MKNAEIKRTIWESRFRQYEIAEEIGISEYTFCRWFRRELSEEQKEQILSLTMSGQSTGHLYGVSCPHNGAGQFASPLTLTKSAKNTRHT